MDNSNVTVHSREATGRDLRRRGGDVVFLAGIATIPFDNLPFAPSRGWAAISPFIFLAYVLLNLRVTLSLRIRRDAYVVGVVALALGVAGWARYGFTVDTVVDSLGTLFLGLAFYLALRVRYESADEDVANRDARVLYGAYLVSFIYGLVWVAVDNFASGGLSFFQAIQMRSYPRLQFTFTEPSFISAHVFGVLLLYTYLVSDARLRGRMVRLGLAFVVVTLLADSSGRCSIDIVVFATLLLGRALFVDTGHVIRNFVLIVAVVTGFFAVMALSPRVAEIVRSGLDFNRDASLASRWFRVQAAFAGFVSDPVGALFGYGLGNLIVPLHEGYDYAMAHFTNSYTAEVTGLASATSVDSLFCGPVRVISDFGLVTCLVLAGVLLSRARRSGVDVFAVVMTLWLYVQFDSYAFYALWLLLFVLEDESARLGESYFQSILRTLSGHGTRRQVGRLVKVNRPLFQALR